MINSEVRRRVFKVMVFALLLSIVGCQNGGEKNIDKTFVTNEQEQEDTNSQTEGPESEEKDVKILPEEGFKAVSEFFDGLKYYDDDKTVYVSEFLGDEFRGFMYYLLDTQLIEGKFYFDSEIENQYLEQFNQTSKNQYALVIASFNSYHRSNDRFGNGEKEWAFIIHRESADSELFVMAFYDDFSILEEADSMLVYEINPVYEELQKYFRFPIVMVKDASSYEIESIGFEESYTLSTLSIHQFYVEKNSFRIGRDGPEGRRRNLFSRAEVNAIRYLSEFVDYDGNPYIKSLDENGMSYFFGNDDGPLDEGIDNEKLLFDSSYYVDIRNRLRKVSDLDSIAKIVDITLLKDFDYNNECLAYVLESDNNLQVYNISTKETLSLGENVSFFHVSGDQVIYQLKTDTDFGVYIYKNGQSQKLLDYLVVDCIYYESKYYFIDVDSRMYCVEDMDNQGTLSAEPELVFEDDIREYIFSDQFIYFTTSKGYVHVLYSIKDGSVSYERALSLGTLAHLSFYFTDGETFYYNGDYEIPFTFSVDLNYRGPIGDVLYENDTTRIEEMSHIGWEFMESSLIITDKIHNEIQIVEGLYHLTNEYVVGDYLYFSAATEWGRAQNIVKFDLSKLTYEIIFEDIDQQWFSIFYFNPSNMTLIYGDNSLAKLNLITGEEEALDIKDSSSLNTLYTDKNMILVYSNNQIIKYDYEAITIIDSYKAKYHYEDSLVYDGKFIYKNQEDQIRLLDIYSNNIITIDEGAKDIFYLKDNAFCYINKEERLVYVNEAKPIVVSSPDQEIEKERNIIEKIGEDIYFLDNISNTIIGYNLKTNKQTQLNVEFKYDSIHSLYTMYEGEDIYLQIYYILDNQNITGYVLIKE